MIVKVFNGSYYESVVLEYKLKRELLAQAIYDTYFKAKNFWEGDEIVIKKSLEEMIDDIEDTSELEENFAEYIRDTVENDIDRYL